MKTQFITPVYKKGDCTEAANYGPVSITLHIKVSQFKELAPSLLF